MEGLPAKKIKPAENRAVQQKGQKESGERDVIHQELGEKGQHHHAGDSPGILPVGMPGFPDAGADRQARLDGEVPRTEGPAKGGRDGSRLGEKVLQCAQLLPVTLPLPLHFGAGIGPPLANPTLNFRGGHRPVGFAIPADD